MKVSIVNIQGVRALRYQYIAEGCMQFDMHLLCEVGEPYQRAAHEHAQKIATRENATIEQIELTDAPWYVDALVKVKP